MYEMPCAKMKEREKKQSKYRMAFGSIALEIEYFHYVMSKRLAD